MTDPLRRELERLGFSDAEIEVYLGVIDVGETHTSELADLTGVSKRHVYRSCERLEKWGLVDVQDQLQPTMIRASPPEEVAAIIEDSYDTILDEVETRYDRSPDGFDQFEVLKREITIVARCRDLIANAEEWVIVVAPEDLVAELVEELAAARQRGVFSLVLTDTTSDVEGRPTEEITDVLRYRERLDVFAEFAVAADYTLSLMIRNGGGPIDTEQYGPGLFFDQKGLSGRIIGSIFANEWRLGTEEWALDPVALPHTFELYPRTVTHAALHRREGTPLRAAVQCRRVQDGEFTEITGKVVGVHQGIVDPYEKSFMSEQTLILRTDDGRVTVGGPPATIEDYAAQRVTLERGTSDDD
ncbi:TrmB family transcriptional regulator sugar-binding domain-containing protein [Halomontanus rarus]|uniref:TrmB family transcriptional regulator sugar-binding domain-containing protein n=1 Tax=Halomontanus rarus TaxID=3034020 RepID=UPI0023E86C2C|nr:TrmB family transcriptional regulator sugar-binding domain-containing protein [Halovivax sp. TS33]